MLRINDPFADMDEVHRFVNWYKHNEHRSDWDETRYKRAKELIELEQTIQRATTEAPSGSGPDSDQAG